MFHKISLFFFFLKNCFLISKLGDKNFFKKIVLNLYFIFLWELINFCIVSFLWFLSQNLVFSEFLTGSKKKCFDKKKRNILIRNEIKKFTSTSEFCSIRFFYQIYFMFWISREKKKLNFFLRLIRKNWKSMESSVIARSFQCVNFTQLT